MRRKPQKIQGSIVSRWLIFCIVALMGLERAELKAEEAPAPDRKAFIAGILKGDDADLQVWWLRPANEKWSEYEFRQITGEGRKILLRLISESKFDPMAGDYALLDLDFETANKRGQGFLVLKRKDSMEGFRLKATVFNKQALIRITPGKFDPAAKIFHLSKHPPDAPFEGYVLQGEFRGILGIPQHQLKK